MTDPLKVDQYMHMSNLTKTLVSMILITSACAYWSFSAFALEDNLRAWFISPSMQHKIYQGQSIEVRIGVQTPDDVNSIALYLDGKLVSKDYKSPFVWKAIHYKNVALRNLKVGTHRLKAKIRDRFGNLTTIATSFQVFLSQVNLDISPTYRCDVTSPLQSLAWLKSIKQRQSNIRIEQYQRGTTTFFLIKSCNRHYASTWYDCTGKRITTAAIRGARRTRILYSGCNIIPKYGRG